VADAVSWPLVAVIAVCGLWISSYALVKVSPGFRSWVDRLYYAAQIRKFQLLGGNTDSSYFSNWGYVSEDYPADGESSWFNTYQKCCENLYKVCIDHFGDLRRKTVLEIGCGKGAGSRFFESKLYNGIDNSIQSIELSKKVGKGSYTVLDAGRAHELNQKFDLVLNVESLMHYSSLDSFFDQIPGLLTDEGVYVATTVVRKSTAYRHMAMFGLPKLEVIDVTENILRAMSLWRGHYPSWVSVPYSFAIGLISLKYIALTALIGPLIFRYEMKHLGYYRWRYLLLVYRKSSA